MLVLKGIGVTHSWHSNPQPMGKRYLSRVKEYYACVTRDLPSTWANGSRASSLSVEIVNDTVGLPALLLKYTQCSRFTNYERLQAKESPTFLSSFLWVTQSFRSDATAIWHCNMHVTSVTLITRSTFWQKYNHCDYLITECHYVLMFRH